MKLRVGTFMTLDGVMQAPGGPDEDREGGFEYGGWVFPHFDQDVGAFMDASTEATDAILFGRKTYEILASYWPNVGDDNSMAAHLNSVRKYVASRTLKRADWNNATILEGDAAESVAAVKEEGGDGVLSVIGSANLIQTLLRHDLVDELEVLVFPVVVGGGKRLFGEGTIPRGLRLTGSQTSGSGVVMLRYERVGEPETAEVPPE